MEYLKTSFGFVFVVLEELKIVSTTIDTLLSLELENLLALAMRGRGSCRLEGRLATRNRIRTRDKLSNFIGAFSTRYHDPRKAQFSIRVGISHHHLLHTVGHVLCMILSRKGAFDARRQGDDLFRYTLKGRDVVKWLHW